MRSSRCASFRLEYVRWPVRLPLPRGCKPLEAVLAAGCQPEKAKVRLTDKIESTLKKLASVSQSLNQASDAVTSRIAEVETALREYKLGIEAWVDIERWSEVGQFGDGTYYELRRIQRLGYGKKGGKWGLLTYVDAEESEDREEFAFLREAPREVRLAAVDKLPDLLEALVEKALETSQEAMKKAEKAKQIAAGLNKKVVGGSRE